MHEELRWRKARQHLWTFFISKIISSLGSSIYSFGISFYILSATGSAMSFAINLILYILPRTLLAPVAGYMADTYNKKKIVIYSQFSSAVVMAGLLLYSMTEGLSLPVIYTASALISITSTFASVTFTSSIANLVNPENIQKATSFNQISLSLATIGGPALGGLLYGFVELPAFISIFIFAYLLATVLESTMNFQLYTSLVQTGKEKMFTSIKNGISYLRKNELLTRIVYVSLIINFLFGAFNIGFSYILIELLKVKSTHFGIIEATSSIGMLLASVFLGVKAAFRSPINVSKWGIIGMGITMSLIALPLMINLPYWGNIFFYISILFSFGALGALVNTPILVVMQNMIEESYRGRVFSLLETMSMALMPLGMLLFGMLYDYLFPPVILIGSGTVLIIFVLWYLPSALIRKYETNIDTEKAVVQEA